MERKVPPALTSHAGDVYEDPVIDDVSAQARDLCYCAPQKEREREREREREIGPSAQLVLCSTLAWLHPSPVGPGRPRRASAAVIFPWVDFLG